MRRQIRPLRSGGEEDRSSAQRSPARATSSYGRGPRAAGPELLSALLLLAACTRPIASAADGGPEYALEVRSSGPQLELEVQTLQGFHLNPDYPVSYRTDEGQRVELKDALRKTPCPAVPDESCAARVQVPNRSGLFAFSLCSKDVCRIEKVPVAAR